MGQFGISIEAIVNLLGLERNPFSIPNSDSWTVRCPFCPDDTKYHLNINTSKDVYKCFRCDSNGGALDLYSRVRFGEAVDRSNSKKYYAKLQEEIGNGAKYERKAHTSASMPASEFNRILPANDDTLDRVYSAMLRLPYLKLSASHKANLQKRGLSPDEIIANGYATMPNPDNVSMDIISKWLSFYDSNKIEAERLNTPRLRNVSRASIAMGFKIAHDILEQGVKLNNIPGFFRIGGEWCVKIDAGILIPTRNEFHQIVGIQTRRDAGNLRYMTLSSKGLSDGVTDNIVRLHIPLSTAPIGKDSHVLITEGPLKSDVALSLLKRFSFNNIVFIALPGVNNTRELPAVAQYLKSVGVTEVYNAFDMDKLVNISVMQACIKMGKIFISEGITPKMYLWGAEYQKRKLEVFCDLAVQYGIEIPDCDSVFETFYKFIIAFTEKKINYDFVVEDDGVRTFEKWSSCEKGIDDHLANLLGIGG